MEFVSLFKNGKTARNYVSYIAWGCTFMGLGLEWKTKAVYMTLDGVRKRELRKFGGSKRIELMLSDSLVHSLVHLADGLFITDGFQELCLLAWEFLLRLQSEGLPLEKGDAEEAQSSALGQHRHSAVWANRAEGMLHLRLARRKHRPRGSWLVRPCTCSLKRSLLGGATYCVVHRMAKYMHNRLVGRRLWDFTAQSFLGSLRRFLKVLKFNQADQLTLKAFRAGKATELAKAGHSLGHILQAGEWRSAAFLRYVDVEQVEIHTAFEEVYASGEEDDD